MPRFRPNAARSMRDTKRASTTGNRAMRPLALTLICCAAWLLAGCEKPEPATYPVSGRPCAPDDPVHELAHTNCVPPG